MKKRIQRAIAVVLVYLMALNTPLFAWGSIGHMAVAWVAYQKLTPATKSRVRALLKLNPDYQKWLGQIPAGTATKYRSMMLFMIAATWPDQIKSEAGYTDDGPDPKGNRPDGASSSQNIGYSDHLHHKYWHFVDTPFSQDGSPLPAIPAPNAETQIAAFRAVLGTNPAGDVKSYDLVWLLHLVGDVHQRLHSSTRVSSTDLEGDNGGNNVALCASPCRVNCTLFGMTCPVPARIRTSQSPMPESWLRWMRRSEAIWMRRIGLRRVSTTRRASCTSHPSAPEMGRSP
jgi:S1/P1 Nuclease